VGAKRLGWPARLALLAGGTLAGLLAAELALRLVDFRFQLYPDRIEFGFPDPAVLESEFVADERLLWVGPNYAEELDRARRERPPLVLMGDSCTAWGLYAKVLVRRVAERDGAALHFLNLAVPGWTTFQGREQMQLDVAPLAPRVVTIDYGWNDHWIGFGVDDETAARLNRSWLYSLRWSRLAQLAEKLVVGHEAGTAVGGGTANGRRPLRVPPDAFRRNLEAMVDDARAAGIAPVLLTAPTSHRRGHEPRYLGIRWIENLDELVPLHQRYVGIVREVAEEKGAALCDLAAAVEALPEPERALLFRGDGIHFTNEGAAFVGEALYDCLERDGLLERLLADG